MGCNEKIVDREPTQFVTHM